MTLNELQQFVRAVLEPSWRDVHQFSPPGVLMRLRGGREFGVRRLRSLMDLLLMEDDATIFVGFYAGGNDAAPFAVMGQPLDRFALRPGYEFDWYLWQVDLHMLETFERELIWPDLVVPGDRAWLLWTGDNYSYLCPPPR